MVGLSLHKLEIQSNTQAALKPASWTHPWGGVPLGEGLGGDPGRARGTRLAWEHLGIPLQELEEVSRDDEVWASLLKLLPHDPASDKAAEHGLKGKSRVIAVKMYQ